MRAALSRIDRVTAGLLLALAAAVALYAWWPVDTEASPTGRFAVADLRGHALMLLDLDRPGNPERVPLPAAPHELIELDDGRIVASLAQGGVLAVVSWDGATVELVATGGIPHGLALDGATLFVTDRSNNLVRRFDTRDWSEGEPFEAGATPHDVAVLPGGALAVANAGDDTLQLGGRALAVSAFPETVSVTAGRVAVAGAHGGDLEIYAPDGTLLTNVELGGRPVRVAFDRAGATLAAALSADGAVALVASDGALRRAAVGGVPDGVAFTHDGRWLLVGDLLGGALSVVDTREGVVIGRIAVGESAGAVLRVTAAR